MSFCTSIHCIDGRIQEPIIRFLKDEHKIAFIDTVTEPAPCKILSENSDEQAINSIIERVNISITRHHSNLIAVSGHYDCAANPGSEKKQKEQIRDSIQYLESRYPQKLVIGLWISGNWQVSRV